MQDAGNVKIVLKINFIKKIPKGTVIMPDKHLTVILDKKILACNLLKCVYCRHSI